ncbi:MAG: hypothetical protein ACFFCQ_16720 [Promethearchaeota archaeon]
MNYSKNMKSTSLIIITLLMVQVTAFQAAETSLEVGATFTFTLKEQTNSLEINGTDYSETNNALIGKGDVFELEVTSIRTINTSDIGNLLVVGGEVNEVNCTLTINDNIEDIVCYSDMWITQFVVILFLTDFNFDKAYPNSTDFSIPKLEDGTDFDFISILPLFAGDNRSRYEEFSNLGEESSQPVNTTIDSIIVTSNRNIDSSLSEDSFSIKFTFHGQKENTTSENKWIYEIHSMFEVKVDLSRQLVEYFSFSMSESEKLGTTNKITTSRLILKEGSEGEGSIGWFLPTTILSTLVAFLIILKHKRKM